MQGRCATYSLMQKRPNDNGKTIACRLMIVTTLLLEPSAVVRSNACCTVIVRKNRMKTEVFIEKATAEEKSQQKSRQIEKMNSELKKWNIIKNATHHCTRHASISAMACCNNFFNRFVGSRRPWFGHHGQIDRFERGVG